MKDKNEHLVEDHKNEEKPKNHYHGEHHFDSKGGHDDVVESDFHWKNSIYINKTNFIFRISLAGVFLALAMVGSVFDILLESIIVPIDGVIISTRFFDITMIILSIASLGPIFSSLLGFITPWFHLLFHGGAGHASLSVVSESIGYVFAVLLIWLFYYVIFKNSYIHKDPNHKKDLIKRWVPMVFFVLVTTLIFTLLNILIIYITSFGHENHDHDSLIRHGDHDHEHGMEWSVFKQKFAAYFFILFGIEIVRFSIIYSLFALIEPRMKILNHRFM